MEPKVVTKIKNIFSKKNTDQYNGSFFHKTWHNKKTGMSLYYNYLINYDPDRIKGETSDTSICFDSGNGITYGILTLENPKYGIILVYDDNDGERWLSVGNAQLLNKIEDVGDDMVFPIGCFIKPDLAWLAISDYFNNAKIRSKQIEWVNSEEIDWPEL